MPPLVCLSQIRRQSLVAVSGLQAKYCSAGAVPFDGPLFQRCISGSWARHPSCLASLTAAEQMELCAKDSRRSTANQRISQETAL